MKNAVKFKKSLFIVASLVSTIAFSSHAADIEAGKKKAATCAACHGVNGISAIPTYPNLAGQKEAYTLAQLKAFKSGERPNVIMKPMASMLSDEDMANVAAYYASLK